MTIPDFGSSLLDVAIRTAIIYVFLVVALRVAGKREVGQLSILDLVVLLVIADAIQNAMVGENTSLLGGIVAASTLIAFDRLLGIIANRSKRVRDVLEGEPRMLVRDGAVLRRALQQEGVDRDELDAVIRSNGLRDVDEVALAVLETNGSISVIPKRGGGSSG
jgi:uncharacterized membrane protein YcaP (DUF421 family)